MKSLVEHISFEWSYLKALLYQLIRQIHFAKHYYRTVLLSKYLFVSCCRLGIKLIYVLVAYDVRLVLFNFALIFQASRSDAHQNELAIRFMEAVLNGLCVIKRTYKFSPMYTA